MSNCLIYQIAEFSTVVKTFNTIFWVWLGWYLVTFCVYINDWQSGIRKIWHFVLFWFTNGSFVKVYMVISSLGLVFLNWLLRYFIWKKDVGKKSLPFRWSKFWKYHELFNILTYLVGCYFAWFQWNFGFHNISSWKCFLFLFFFIFSLFFFRWKPLSKGLIKFP